jgi:hypothetical protein
MSREQINELRGLLREADKKAEAGDAQAKADAQGIFNQIQYLEDQLKTQSNQEYPPVLAGGLGEGALITGKGVQFLNQVKNMPKVVEDVVANQKAHNEVLADLIKQNQMMTERGVAQPHGGGNWTGKLTGISPTGSQMNQPSLKRAQGMVEAIGPEGLAPGSSISETGNIIITPDVKAERAAAMALRDAKIAEEIKRASIMGKLGHGARVIGDLGGRALTKVNPYLQAFSVPYEAADIYNKVNRGDTVGAGLSTLGALSGVASLYPPITVPAGLLSLGAHGADWAYQNYLERKGKPQQGYEEQPAQYAIGGLVFTR